MKIERRRHIRVPGPFAASRVGDRPTPVRILNLSEGGCFIESATDHPRLGRPIELEISFPNGQTVSVRGETLYTRPDGYAVLFDGLSDEAYAVLERAMASLRSLAL